MLARETAPCKTWHASDCAGGFCAGELRPGEADAQAGVAAGSGGDWLDTPRPWEQMPSDSSVVGEVFTGLRVSVSFFSGVAEKFLLKVVLVMDVSNK